MSLEATEAECGANATAPRVSLAEIEGAITDKAFLTGEWFLKAANGGAAEAPDSVRGLTICMVVMTNGFVVIGKSAPASPANFNAALGRNLAYEDAVRQIWPLMGFALRNRLSQVA